MKECPNCKKEYHSSWNICIQCGVLLKKITDNRLGRRINPKEKVWFVRCSDPFSFLVLTPRSSFFKYREGGKSPEQDLICYVFYEEKEADEAIKRNKKVMKMQQKVAFELDSEIVTSVRGNESQRPHPRHYGLNGIDISNREEIDTIREEIDTIKANLDKTMCDFCGVDRSKGYMGIIKEFVVVLFFLIAALFVSHLLDLPGLSILLLIGLVCALSRFVSGIRKYANAKKCIKFKEGRAKMFEGIVKEKEKHYKSFKENERMFEVYREEVKKTTQRDLRRKKTYWRKLSGIQFEKEVASLYEKLGYEVELTPQSGDGGIDIILDSEIIVQCKAHKKPIGRPDFQRLYGVLVDKKEHKRALMVCLKGGTKDALEFIANKPITVVDIDEIIRLNKNAE